MKKDDDFIMLPTADFCFVGLMDNPKVRKGFVAAIMKIPPEKIKETVLLPTILKRESEDDKLGILDVCVILEDGTQLDLILSIFRVTGNAVERYISVTIGRKKFIQT